MPRVTIGQIFEIGSQFAKSPLVTQVVFEKSADPTLPDGLYLKPRVHYGDWERPWKIDIWSLDESVIAQKTESMQRFKAKMTPTLREQIVHYKFSIMNAEYRTPMFSGYFTYKAFIDEGMTDFEQITQYLIKNGINVERISHS